MAENGKLPNSELAAIPGGQLAKEAAANWLALRAEGSRKFGVLISPVSSRCAYRTFAEQQYFWGVYQKGGPVAARPGTSNHGWGKAIDLANPATMRKVIDSLGGPYGWKWGEAPSESWHVTYYGGGKADPRDVKVKDHPTLRRGDKGDDVRRVQKWLSEHGEKEVKPDRDYGPITEKAVKRLYRAWGHFGHGRFGDVGWSIIEGKHPWRVLGPEERETLAALYGARRRAHRKEGWDKLEAADREAAAKQLAWLIARRKHIWRRGKEAGWGDRRRRRYQLLKQATTKGGPP